MSLDVRVRGAHQVADWIETLSLVHERASLPVDSVLALTKEHLEIGEALTAMGLKVMGTRARQLGSRYPFHSDDIAVRRRSDAVNSPYSALLHLTVSSLCRQLLYPRPSDEMEVLFEHMVCNATAEIWGEDGRAIRFGWPSDIGRPQSFDQAIDWLAQLMGLEAGTGFRPLTRKDGGVDVVSWHDFPDRRAGVPVLLVQCTLQRDLKSKASDVETRVWGSWLAMEVDPLTALAFPQTLASENQWNQLSIRTLLLDRVRLVNLLRDANAEDSAEWSTRVTASLASMLREVL